MSTRGRFDTSQFRITRGAFTIAALQIGMSIVWLCCDRETQGMLLRYLAATPSGVLHHGYVWTLATGPLIETDFFSLLLNMFMLWMFVPTLERFWGTRRFVRFAIITSIIGSLAGVLCGELLGREALITGLSPFTMAAVVAFGIVYARQPVQFFGVLPLTGRQMMYGFIGFLTLFVVLQGLWERGAANGGAMLTAAIMTSKRWSPGLAWRKWRIARARAKLSVIEGGAPKPPSKPTSPKKKSDERFLN
ncbi:MAG: rhomboid family intramembrane serine protease [Kofleriaceae bacterium]